jgi:YbgC/YbaW family acyl-CoA thioester hydrolase
LSAKAYSKLYSIGAELVEPVYKHVHHADALRLLEAARLDYIASIGFPTEAFIAQNQFLVITKIEIDYKRELLGGGVLVTCEEVFQVGKQIAIRQAIYNGRGKEAVSALVYSALMDGASKRAIELPRDFLLAAGIRGAT